MNVIELSASSRETTRGASARAARKAGQIPGVMYGADKTVHFTAENLALRKLIFTPDFNLVDLDVDGSKHRCIIKDYQLHPVTDEVVHVDFLALKDGHPLKVEIPVRFVGASEGIKAGGTLVQKLRKVKVKTTPDKLVDVFEVDISHLLLGDSVRVRDMKVAEGIEIMNPEAIPMASIEVPRALKAAEAAAAAEGEEGAEEATAEATAE